MIGPPIVLTGKPSPLRTILQLMRSEVSESSKRDLAFSSFELLVWLVYFSMVKRLSD